MYAVDWAADRITWTVDGAAYHRVTRADVGADRWVFDKPFFLLLNLAVGGGWPGDPDDSHRLPAGDAGRPRPRARDWVDLPRSVVSGCTSPQVDLRTGAAEGRVDLAAGGVSQRNWSPGVGPLATSHAAMAVAQPQQRAAAKS